MNRYIALLRAINVGGHKKIKMADLKAFFESLGFTNVVTYIQSGNVVFSSEGKTSSEVISEAIEETFGLEVPVLIKSPSEIEEILDQCPFPKEKKEKSYFMLLYKPPLQIAIETTLSYQIPNEEFHITPQCVYFHCATGYGRAKLSGNFFEQKLKVPVTARNYRTMTKLIELAS